MWGYPAFIVIDLKRTVKANTAYIMQSRAPNSITIRAVFGNAFKPIAC